MFDELLAINWETLGVTILGYLGIFLGIVAWLKKNIANFQQLKKDGGDIADQALYFKAMLKDSSNLKSEISEQKLMMRDMKNEFKIMSERRDQEVSELKLALKEAIQVIKEEAKNDVS